MELLIQIWQIKAKMKIHSFIHPFTVECPHTTGSELCPTKLFVKVLTSRTSECVHMWRQSL